MQKRSVAAVVIFSILTCGIYLLYWTYVTADGYHRVSGRAMVPPVLTTLLMLFSPAGGALLALDADDSLNAIKVRYGMPPVDNRVVWLLLGIFLPIVTAALIQNEINLMNDAARRGPYSGGSYSGGPYSGGPGTGV